MPRTTGGKQRTYYDWEEPIYVIIRFDVTSHALRFCTNGTHHCGAWSPGVTKCNNALKMAAEKVHVTEVYEFHRTRKWSRSHESRDI